MELQHNITFRKKDKGWQYIISYKIDKIGVWKQKSKQGFTSKLEAKKAADKMLDGLKEELSNNLSLNSDFSNITLREFYNIYIANSQHRLTASTLNNFKYTIKAFDEIVDIELRKIKTQDIQRCVNALYNAGKKQATIETRLAYIQILFNSAVKEYNIILRSPGDSVKLKTNKEIPTRRALTDQEAEDLLEALKKEKNIRYYIIALILLTSGMRIGECLGLTEDVLDFKNNSIKINKQFKFVSSTEYGLGELKSKNSNRVIPIPESTMNVIKLYIDMYPRAKDGRIFDFGEKRSFQTVMNKRIKTLGFNVCLHELRHTYATKLVASGLDFKTAAYILGHTVEQTMNTYSHVTDDMKEIAANKINNIFKSDTNNKE